jgi:RecB family endonuclease NucS
LAAKKDPGPSERRAVVHDLNNDLSVIIGQCDMLQGSLTQASDEAARVNVIKTTGAANGR